MSWLDVEDETKDKEGRKARAASNSLTGTAHSLNGSESSEVVEDD